MGVRDNQRFLREITHDDGLKNTTGLFRNELKEGVMTKQAELK